ncbi:t-SNARE [Mycena leptocephala]|nr:t-SNARE [Mycena leptocephala]
MANDRMAAYRAQRQAGQPTNQSHELTNIAANDGGNGPSLSGMPGFHEEATSVQDSIGTFSANVQRISELNTRSLDALGNDEAAIKQELDALVAQTMSLSAQLKDRLKQLQDAVLPGARGRQEKEMRQNRVTHVRTKFTEALQRYQEIEKDYRAKSRQRVERQYRIEEITQAVSGGGDQVFMQALTESPSYSHARSAYNEVQSRAQDLRKMEQTFAELAQLFSDMALLVQQQDETLVAIENTAVDVEHDAKEGETQVTIAVGIARSLRKKRWICFIIVVIVVAILAIVLAIEFAKPNNH